MKRPGSFIIRGITLLLIAVLGLLVVGGPLARADSPATASWAAPSAGALQRVGSLSDTPHESLTFGNIDCQQLTYRLTTSSTMFSGCFMQTALGLLDMDDGLLIFNGTDEAVPLKGLVGGSTLTGVPGSRTLVNLLPLAIDGVHVGLYRNPVPLMKPQQNLAGQIIGESLSAPPEIILSNAAGAPLVVDPDSIAISGNGRWLIVEVVAGSFIRVDLDTLEETVFAPSFTGLVGLSALHSQIAVSDDGRFIAIDNDLGDSSKVYDTSTCTNGICAAHEYRPFIRQQISGLQRIRHLRFLNDTLLSFEATSSLAGNSGEYELAPDGHFGASIGYLGLGDSYTSGEGAFDYLAGTDTATNTCHLSARSYPLLLSYDAFDGAGHSVACSGAVINDVTSRDVSYRGQATDTLPAGQVLADFSPGHLSQHHFVQQYQPRIVTVSIGGNDIGFGDIIQQCVAPHLTLNPNGNTCFGTYEDRLEVTNLIGQTVPRWVALYKQLQAEAPLSQLYAIGYPQIAVPNGNCGLNVHLNNSELTFAAQLIDYLDSQIRAAAAMADVPYLDISQALEGHRLCETSGSQVAMNGLTAGTDFGIGTIKMLGRESYHPNMLGQRLIEQSILRQTHNFTQQPAEQDEPLPTLELLNVPKSGRAILALQPVSGMAADSSTRGLPITIHLDGAPYGLLPNSQYRVQIDTYNIGSVPTNSSAQISATITVPNNAAVGGHLLSIQGRNQLQAMVSVYEPFYVQYSSADADGDLIPDSLDSCPTSPNSGQDSDSNGVDDACGGRFDNTLGANPNGPGSSTPDPTVTAGEPAGRSTSAASINLQPAANIGNSPVASVQATNLPPQFRFSELQSPLMPRVLGARTPARQAVSAQHQNLAKKDLEGLLFCLLLLLLARRYTTARCKT